MEHMEHQIGPDDAEAQLDAAGDTDATAAVDADQAAESIWAESAIGAEPAIPPKSSEAAPATQAEPAAVPRAADQPADGAQVAAPATGEPRVDAALKLLDRLPELPISEHSELFEQVHAQLSEVLGELDTGPAGGPGSAGR
jgi:hypothetical protein